MFQTHSFHHGVWNQMYKEYVTYNISISHICIQSARFALMLDNHVCVCDFDFEKDSGMRHSMCSNIYLFNLNFVFQKCNELNPIRYHKNIVFMFFLNIRSKLIGRWYSPKDHIYMERMSIIYMCNRHVSRRCETTSHFMSVKKWS